MNSVTGLIEKWVSAFNTQATSPFSLPKGINVVELSEAELKEGLSVYVVVTRGENQSVESRLCQEKEDGAGSLFLAPLERSSIDIDPVLVIPLSSPSMALTAEDYEHRLNHFGGEVERLCIRDLDCLLQDLSIGQPGSVKIEMEDNPPFMMLKEAMTGLGRMTKITCNGKILYNFSDPLPADMQERSIWIFAQFLEAFDKEGPLTQNLMKLILQNSLARIITRLTLMCNKQTFGYYISHALSNEVNVLPPNTHATEDLEGYVKIEIKLRFAVINIDEAAKSNRFIQVTREILIDPKDLSEGSAGDGIMIDSYSSFLNF